jgi:hypothetical protein
MKFELEELEADAAEEDLLAASAAARTDGVASFERKKPFKRAFPNHLLVSSQRRGRGGEKSCGRKASLIYPIALEAVQKIDALFAIERDVKGGSAAVRLAAHQEYSAPLRAELKDWLGGLFAKLSRSHDLAKAINYMLRQWDAFTCFLDDGRVCLLNNAAERALRSVNLGRKAWLFCGSDRGGQRAAIAYSLIQTCRFNDIDPQAWLADARSHPSPAPDDCYTSQNQPGDFSPYPAPASLPTSIARPLGGSRDPFP